MNVVGLLLLAVLIGCGSKPPAEEGAQSSPAPGTTTSSGTKAPSMMGKLMKQTVTIPAGTVIEVRTNQTLSSKSSQPGESFSAAVEVPVEVDGKVVIPKG